MPTPVEWTIVVIIVSLIFVVGRLPAIGNAIGRLFLGDVDAEDRTPPTGD